MKVLIIGLGSIAQKHIKSLKKVVPNVEILSLRSNKTSIVRDEVTNIFAYEDVPKDINFVLISNPTSEHYNTILKVIRLKAPIFLEKPPFAKLEGSEELLKEIKKNKIITYTAFNFRFHPLIMWVKQNIDVSDILEVQAYCGSYLPDWRPGQDYKNSYSAKAKMGGGVHLDLIHELDYLKYLFGSPLNTTKFLSKVSELEIDSFDCAHYWLEYSSFNVSVLLNYYRKDTRRKMDIVLKNESIEVDLLNFKIKEHTGKVIFEADKDIQQTYDEQMKYFIACLEKGSQPLNSLEESIETLKICLS